MEEASYQHLCREFTGWRLDEHERATRDREGQRLLLGQLDDGAVREYLEATDERTEASD